MLSLRLLCLNLLFCPLLIGQSVVTQHANLAVDPAANRTYSNPLKDASPFLAYAFSWTGETTSFQIRFSDDNSNWGKWETILVDDHLGDQASMRRVSRLYTTEQTKTFFQVAADNFDLSHMEQLTIHFFDPGQTPLEKQWLPSAPTKPVCAQPEFLSRNDWCCVSSCPPDATPQLTEATHVIVHHSAGTNNSPDWSATVRAIWNLHVNVNGWDDIGYNWLIDPTGRIYEGRGDGALGAHFCGKNSKTLGVCLLGTFTHRAPSGAAIESLNRLIAWKSLENNIDPRGISYHNSSGALLDNISGHRDGCSTECPGSNFYPLIPQLRREIADLVDSECGVVTTTTKEIEASSIHVFPNPLLGRSINIEWSNPDKKALRTRLVSSDGRQIGAQLLNSNLTTWNLPALTAGIYFLQFQDQGATITKKLVIY